MKIEILKELISIANSLDAKGFQKEAAVVDGIIKRAEEDEPSSDEVTKAFIRNLQGQDFSGNEMQMINAYLKAFMKNPSYFGDSGPAGDVTATNTWNNSTQEAWKRFVASAGRSELAQNWKSRATNIGYEPNVSGALKFIRDRMEETLGGSTNPAELRSVDGEMARGKHFFDTLVRIWDNGDGRSNDLFANDLDYTSQHRDAANYARQMGLEIPYLDELSPGVLLDTRQVTAPARGIAGTVEEGDSNLSAPGDPYSFSWNEDAQTYTVVAANQSMGGKSEAVGRVIRKPSLSTDTDDEREAAKQSAWHILTKRRLGGKWLWEQGEEMNTETPEAAPNNSEGDESSETQPLPEANENAREGTVESTDLDSTMPQNYEVGP